MSIPPNPSGPNRRLVLKILSTAAAVPLIAAPAADAATLAEIRKRGSLAVASEDDFKPFEFIRDGRPTGYDIELFAAISKGIGVGIRHDMIPWTGILPGVVTGKYDLAVTAVLITPERLKMLDFTSPVAESVDYYMKRTDDKRIGAIKDLSGLTLGVEAGSAMLKLLPQLDAMLKSGGGRLGKVVQYQDYPSAYQDLAAGRLDYVVNTYLNLRNTVLERPRLFALGQPVSKPIYIAWAMQKGNAALLALIDGELAKARKDGTMAKLQRKWFGTTFPHLPANPASA